MNHWLLGFLGASRTFALEPPGASHHKLHTASAPSFSLGSPEGPKTPVSRPGEIMPDSLVKILRAGSVSRSRIELGWLPP